MEVAIAVLWSHVFHELLAAFRTRQVDPSRALMTFEGVRLDVTYAERGRSDALRGEASSDFDQNWPAFAARPCLRCAFENAHKFCKSKLGRKMRHDLANNTRLARVIKTAGDYDG